MTLTFGLVGCGGMGRRHIGGMARLKAVDRLNFDLVAVCDLFPHSAQAAADLAEEKLGRKPAQFTNLTDMLKATQLDAIIVTTTPETHTSVGLEAFEAGLHVMVEKPITLTTPQGLALVQAAERTGRKLAVAENYRRDPVNRLAKALLEAGVIGRPYLFSHVSSSTSGGRVIITPWRHLKRRGGIVFDMGVHYADILEFFLGPIDTVVGMNDVVDQERTDSEGNVHPADAEDLLVGVGRYRSGAMANWMMNLAGRGRGEFSRTVFGTGGSLAIPSDRSGRAQVLTVRENGEDREIPVDDLLGLVPDFHLDETTAALYGADRLATYDLPFPETDANLLAVEQADLAEAILHDRQPEVDGEQGLRSLALVFGFLESERLGRIVQVDEIMHSDNLPYQSEMV